MTSKEERRKLLRLDELHAVVFDSRDFVVLDEENPTHWEYQQLMGEVGQKYLNLKRFGLLEAYLDATVVKVAMEEIVRQTEEVLA